MRASSPNTVQEPVVKSCRRVPIASTRSASAARRFAWSQPVTPTGPTQAGGPPAEAGLPSHRLDHG